MTSQYFALAEFLDSDTARAHGLANYPTWLVVDNLARLAAVMEEVRRILGNSPITITSGFRCPELNALVGGVADSAHLDGLAADFTAGGFGDPLAVCKALEPYVAVLEIDQLIHENDSWIHLGLCHDDARYECLTIDSSGMSVGFA